MPEATQLSPCPYLSPNHKTSKDTCGHPIGTRRSSSDFDLLVADALQRVLALAEGQKFVLLGRGLQGVLRTNEGFCRKKCVPLEKGDKCRNYRDEQQRVA